MARDRVRLSKALSWLLRHNAEKEGFTFLEGGFLPVHEVLKHKRLVGYTVGDVKAVVAECPKQRFLLREGSDGGLLVRANQGHSVPSVEVELEEVAGPSPPPVVVHGTYRRSWEAIRRGGLSRMARNHIHFSAGEPGEGEVISGMRKSADLKIYLDLPKALATGLRFYRSANNVILSPGDAHGLIPASLFLKVIDVRTGRDILETHNGSAAMESSDSNVLSNEVKSDLLKEKKMKKRTEKLAKIQKLKGEQAEGKKLEKKTS